MQEELFQQTVNLLTEQGLILKKGTIVDFKLIAASLINQKLKKKLDLDAHSVKKDNRWHFGYKAHVGLDKDTELIHHVEVTSANIHDAAMVTPLITRLERSIYGDDSGYLGLQKREDAVKRN